VNASDYEEFLGVARKFARRAGEAEDLLQEALLAAARGGRLDLADDGNRRWLVGTLRNQGAMAARTEGRRRARERSRAPIERSKPPDAHASLDRLPPAARGMVALIVHGMSRDEITRALGLTPAAFRQRLVAVRKALAGGSPEMQREALALAYLRGRDHDGLELGLVRRALLAYLHITDGVGTHDPDGHLIVISPSRNGRPRQR
jgi:DNA-directed RNA polymerase specialized sigma24 family protein